MAVTAKEAATKLAAANGESTAAASWSAGGFFAEKYKSGAE